MDDSVNNIKLALPFFEAKKQNKREVQVTLTQISKNLKDFKYSWYSLKKPFPPVPPKLKMFSNNEVAINISNNIQMADEDENKPLLQKKESRIFSCFRNKRGGS